MLERLFLSPSPFPLPSSSRTTLTVPRETEERQGEGRIHQLSLSIFHQEAPGVQKRSCHLGHCLLCKGSINTTYTTWTHMKIFPFQERRRERERGKRLWSPECSGLTFHVIDTVKSPQVLLLDCNSEDSWPARGMCTSPAGKPGTGQQPTAQR